MCPAYPKKRKTADHVFYCSNESCDRAFKTMASLENHLFLGDCSVRSEKKLLDKCKTMYQDKLDKLVHVNNKTHDSDDANTSIVSKDLIKFLADSYNMIIRKTVYSNSFFMINSKKTT